MSDLTPPHGIVRPSRLRRLWPWRWLIIALAAAGYHTHRGEWYPMLLLLCLAAAEFGDIASTRLIEAQREHIALLQADIQVLQAEIEQAYFRPGWRP